MHILRCTRVAFLALLAPLSATSRAHTLVGGPFLTDLTPTEVTVSWETKYLSSGRVDVRFPGGTRTFRSDGERRTMHHVRLTELPPDTECRYTVHLDGEALREYPFRTAPLLSRTFRFAAYGDSQERHGGRHGKVADAILTHRPNFVLHSGDYTMRATRSDWASEFFRPASNLLASVPIVAAPGNREAGSLAFRDYFVAPSSPTWRSWRYASLEAFVLDTNEDLLLDSPQHTWLGQALAASKAHWKVVVFHHPLYSSSRHGSDETLRCALMPLFLEHGVDLVMVGHDQCYERTLPIGTGEQPERNALFHVVSGGGGGSIYNVYPKIWTAKSRSSHHYCIVDVTDSKLTITAYNLDGDAFDTATLTKSGNKPRCTDAMAAEAVNFFDSAQQFNRLYLPAVGADHANCVRLRFENPYARDLKGSIAWKLPNKGWSIQPSACDVTVPAGGKAQAVFTVTFDPTVAGPDAHQSPEVLLTAGTRTVAVPAFTRTLRQFASPLLTR